MTYTADDFPYMEEVFRDFGRLIGSVREPYQFAEEAAMQLAIDAALLTRRELEPMGPMGLCRMGAMTFDEELSFESSAFGCRLFHDEKDLELRYCSLVSPFFGTRGISMHDREVMPDYVLGFYPDRDPVYLKRHFVKKKVGMLHMVTDEDEYLLEYSIDGQEIGKLMDFLVRFELRFPRFLGDGERELREGLIAGYRALHPDYRPPEDPDDV